MLFTLSKFAAGTQMVSMAPILARKDLLILNLLIISASVLCENDLIA